MAQATRKYQQPSSVERKPNISEGINERYSGWWSKKNMLAISGKDITRESNQMNQTNDAEQVTSCNEIIEEVIVNRKHIAAVDGSMTKDSYQLFG